MFDLITDNFIHPFISFSFHIILSIAYFLKYYFFLTLHQNINGVAITIISPEAKAEKCPIQSLPRLMF